MAYLYVRGKYHWISFIDAEGKRRNVSTGFRLDVPLEVRKARALEAQRTADELARGISGRRKGSGWSWVTEWIRLRYGHSPGTTRLYLNCWKPLSLFLHERKVSGPEALGRQHCFDYITWRTSERPPNGCWPAIHNTALNEIHILRVFMQEAVNRGIVEANPCLRLGIRKHETTRKAEFTDDDIAKIRTETQKVRRHDVRDMLHASFEIAIHQGCRLFETRVHLLNDVDLQRQTITFHTKQRTVHTTLLHPGLRPVIEDLIQRGKVWSWDAPPGHLHGVWAGRHWTHFVRKIKLGKTFHSCRVTVITRLARAGVSRTKAMSFVGHATSAIHTIYTRLVPEDLSDCVAALAPSRGQGGTSDGP